MSSAGSPTIDDCCEESLIHPDAVREARAALPAPYCVERATNILKVVGDQTRLKILSALAVRELCVCDLAAVVGISESAISHQLRLLRAVEVVAFRKEGRVAYYRLADHHVSTLLKNALEHAEEGHGHS